MENVENQAIALQVEGQENFIADLSATRVTSFCSLVATTPAQKAQLYKAMNNPEKRLGDCINMTINAKDIFAEVVECVNKDTGEAKKCPRIVIIDDKGVGYQCVSVGIFSAVKKLFQVFGLPTWQQPIKLKVVQITKGDRKLLTLDIA
jgi:hypothetical protein